MLRKIYDKTIDLSGHRHAAWGLAGVSFAERLGESLNSVAESQNKAAQSVKDYELGREQDLSKVMVEQQISSLGFQLTLNVRNKALSAYKEIMNMPV